MDVNASLPFDLKIRWNTKIKIKYFCCSYNFLYSVTAKTGDVSFEMKTGMYRLEWMDMEIRPFMFV